MSTTKDQAARMFKHFLVWFEKRFNCMIHVLRTDGGAEYQTLDLFCKSTGVRRQKTEAHRSASNGKAERMHRKILETARTMLYSSGLSLRFWGDAILYATYIVNGTPCMVNGNNKSAYERLTGQSPDLRKIVAFGSSCTAMDNYQK